MIANVYIGNIATATGTSDVITASYVPAPTVLADKMILYFRATAANATTTPTFSPNGLTAHTIVKQGGTALAAGDIPAVGAVMEIVYDEANTRWELLNPATDSVWNKSGANVSLKTITDSVGIGNATPSNKLQVVGGITANSSDAADVWRIGYDNGNDICKIDIANIQSSISAGTATTGASVIIESNGRITLTTVGAAIRLAGSGFQAFDDDGAAGAGGLATGDIYQTTGSGAAPLNVAGILMVKQ